MGHFTVPLENLLIGVVEPISINAKGQIVGDTESKASLVMTVSRGRFAPFFLRRI